MKRKTLLLCMILIWVNCVLLGHTAGSHPGKNDIEFQHLGIKEGLSNSWVKCIMEDSRGFLWFGTKNGLNRYDGYTFKSYFHRPGDPGSLNHSSVKALAEDSGGKIWIGTETGLCFYHRDSDDFTRCTTVSTPQGEPALKKIYCIYIDRRETVWLGTSGQGLVKFDRRTKEFSRYNTIKGPNGSPLKRISIPVIRRGPKGAVWVAVLKHGLYKFDPVEEVFSPVSPLSSAGKGPWKDKFIDIRGIAPDKEGNMWIGMVNEGLVKINPETLEYLHYRPEAHNPGALCSWDVGALCLDRTGCLWIGTFGCGVERLFPGEERFFHSMARPDKSTTLKSNQVISLYEDSQGIVWAGTAGGDIGKYVPGKKKFRYHYNDPSDPHSLNSGEVTTIYEDRGGTLWFGTWGGGLNRYHRQENRFSHYLTDTEETQKGIKNVIISIYEDSSGLLWVATGNRKLKQMDARRQKLVNVPIPPPAKKWLSNTVFTSILEIEPGIIWLGTMGKGVIQYDKANHSVHRYLLNPGQKDRLLMQNAVIHMLKGREGIAWIATRRGLCRFKPASQESTWYLPDKKNFRSKKNDILYLHRCGEGYFWLGTNGGRLSRLDPETGEFTFYGKKDGIPGGLSAGILEDGAGCLWFGTRKGLVRFDKKKRAAVTYTTADGLLTHNFLSRSCFRAKNGEMYFGGGNGVNVFHPADITVNAHIPPVVISEFSVLDPSPAPGDSPGAVLKHMNTEGREVRLRYSQDFFTITFAALDFHEPGQNRYAYKLEGIDQGWIYCSAQNRRVSYANIVPGTYYFKVKASNNDGLWNETGATLKIVVLPAFWQTTWFRVSVVFLLAGMLYYLYLRRIGTLSREFDREVKMERFYTHHKVSGREREIIGLVVKGKSNKEIESELYISLDTVKTHLYNIYRKLKIKNRVQLIRMITTYLSDSIQ